VRGARSAVLAGQQRRAGRQRRDAVTREVRAGRRQVQRAVRDGRGLGVHLALGNEGFKVETVVFVDLERGIEHARDLLRSRHELDEVRRDFAATIAALGEEVRRVQAGRATKRRRRVRFIARIDIGGAKPRRREGRAGRRVRAMRQVLVLVVRTLVRRDGGLLVEVDETEEVEAVLVVVAHAQAQVGRVCRTARMLRRVQAERDRAALVILARDEVDHAGDGVRAVQRGSAVAQDFDALDGSEGDGVQVGSRRVERAVGDATAVQQHEGLVRAQAAQVGEGSAAGGSTNGLRRRLLNLHRADALHDLLDGRDALLLQVVRLDDGDRLGGFRVDALDRRARDFHALNGGVLGEGARGNGEHAAAESQEKTRTDLRTLEHGFPPEGWKG
jgi:hypothetical protein